MIEELSLRHFKQHVSMDIVFPPGLTMISGQNYSGKTSILHGILFALWGVSAVPGGAKRVTTRGAAGAKTLARMRFYHDGATYVIERGVSSAKLYRGDQLLATSVSAVSKELEQVIGMPARYFNHLKYAEQGGTQALLTLGAAELHKVLEHVSGANLVNRVITRASTLASEATAALAALGEAPDLAHLRKELGEATDTVQGLQTELDHAAKHAEIVSTSAAASSWAFGRAQENNRLVREARQVVNGLTAQIEEARDRVKTEANAVARSAQQISGAERTLQAYEAARQLEQQWRKASTACAQTDRELSRAQDAWHHAREQLAKATDALAQTADADVEGQVALKAGIEARMAQAKVQYGALAKALEQSACPECGRPYDDAADLEQLQVQLDDVVDAYNTAEAELKACERRLGEHLSMRRAHQDAERHLQSATEDEARAKQGFKVAQAAATAAQAELDRLNAEGNPPEVGLLKDEAEKAQRALGFHAAATEALERTTAHLATLEQLLHEAHAKAPAKPEVDLGPLEDRARQDREADEAARRKVVDVRYQLSAKEEHVKSVQRELERALQEADKINRYAAQKASAGSLVRYLRTNRDRFMSELWEQVTRYASGFAAACTGGAIAGIQRTADGAFTFTEDGYEDEVVTASGGQRSIMSLGIQLALDTLLPDTLGALLLDEPTADLDPAHATTLTQALSQSGRQVIMVSHRELDASVAQAHIQLG